MSSLPLLCSIVVEILANAVRHEKEINGIQIVKVHIKLSLFTGDMIINEENLEPTKKILELISEYTKAGEYS